MTQTTTADSTTVDATPAWRERLTAFVIAGAALGIVPEQTPQLVDAALAGGAALVSLVVAFAPGARGRIARRFGRRG